MLMSIDKHEQSNYYEFYGDLFDSNSINKTKTVCRENYLMLYDSCFWCASSLVEFKYSKMCHNCMEGVINDAYFYCLSEISRCYNTILS